MGRITYIYALKDPRTGEVRYVGKADDTGKRLKEHVYEARATKESNPYKGNWIRSLLREGCSPELVILAKVPFNIWQAAEAEWMAKFENLTNIAEAGQGGDLGPVVRAKISKSLTGKKRPGLWTPESKRKLSNTLRGRTFTEEHKAKISTSLKGKKRPPSAKLLAHLKKGNKSKTGQHLSEETKRKISESQKRRFQNANRD